VVIADSFAPARRAPARTLPHVILAEVTLPHMSAARLLLWLANNFQTRRIPVIVMTDGAGAADAIVRSPAAGVLIKPFGLAAMLDEVRRVLRAR
jgi:DNA-binding response OmpR family regulator